MEAEQRNRGGEEETQGVGKLRETQRITSLSSNFLEILVFSKLENMILK